MGTDAPPVLRTRSLVHRYGKVEVLRGLDMNVLAGEVYGFLGRNGSGKTTAMRICMGIVKASGGAIEILGEEVPRPTVAQKRQIGYVSQEQHFYPWMRCAALGRFVGAFYPTWDGAEFARLLRAFDVPPDRRAAQLSGGMRAKLGLALALAHRPRLLLLDEPTAGLDPAARREFLEIVRLQAREGRHTTFFSSHIVEEVERVAHRVGILDRGRLIYEGDLQTLRESVRRVDLAPDADAGALVAGGFELLSDERTPERRSLVLRGSPEAWASVPHDGAAPLSLEDAFLALTVGRLFAA